MRPRRRTDARLRRELTRMRDDAVVARSCNVAGMRRWTRLRRQQAVLSEKAVQGGAVDPERLGRKGQIAFLLLDRFLEELLFKPFKGLPPPFAVAAEPRLPFSRRQDRLREALHADERPRGIGH